MLSFLKSPCKGSNVRVKTQDAPGTLSDPIPIERGLRQGCPASPILLNIVIFDIFDGIEGLGFEVPGCVDMLDSRQPVRVPGQLLAHDAVGLAPPLDILDAMFARFSQWAEKKFRVMALGRHSDAFALREQADRWRLGGERAPIVYGCRYLLGELKNPYFSMRNIAGDGVKKSRRADEALDSVLGGRNIPINIRTSVLETCILPVLTYGCEV
jgi:hypothetical protein